MQLPQLFLQLPEKILGLGGNLVNGPLFSTLQSLTAIVRFDVFQTLFGLGILVTDLYVYINAYYGFQGKEQLGWILSIMLIVGIWLLGIGMGKWSRRYELERREEDQQKLYEIKVWKRKIRNLRNSPPAFIPEN